MVLHHTPGNLFLYDFHTLPSIHLLNTSVIMVMVVELMRLCHFIHLLTVHYMIPTLHTPCNLPKHPSTQCKHDYDMMVVVVVIVCMCLCLESVGGCWCYVTWGNRTTHP